MTTDIGMTGPDQPAPHSSEAPPRCAQCRALLADGIVWCAQCYAPIVPPQAEPPPTATADPATAVTETSEHIETGAPGGQTAARSGDGVADTDVPERGPIGGTDDPVTIATADQMLALLGTAESSGSGSGRWRLASVTPLMSNTGVRVGVIVGGTLLLTMVGFGLLSLLGQLL